MHNLLMPRSFWLLFSTFIFFIGFKLDCFLSQVLLNATFSRDKIGIMEIDITHIGPTEHAHDSLSYVHTKREVNN